MILYNFTMIRNVINLSLADKVGRYLLEIITETRITPISIKGKTFNSSV